MARKQSKGLIRRPVIDRNSLPMNFPHYAIIYAILMGVLDLPGWVKITLWILCGLWILIYLARKLVEKPEIKINYTGNKNPTSIDFERIK